MTMTYINRFATRRPTPLSGSDVELCRSFFFLNHLCHHAESRDESNYEKDFPFHFTLTNFLLLTIRIRRISRFFSSISDQQILHHGSTAVLWEPDIPAERSTYVYLRLERSCSHISWQRTAWRRIKSQHGE